ncbi:hypothetical protein [Anaeromicropila populeti]|uniref:Uncharacterized protein n=1 Tax=Anaeromicropila populeti TaxID=37658 RepID=A0A1I6JEF0_9FIRM|nr:hypothetical protein [Anaeromicropila populeti]SFR77413.1 hypothetical protein SAMN05661086_01618 [Anaeromicropila populeti]
MLKIIIKTDNKKDFTWIVAEFVKALQNDCPFHYSENKPECCSEDCRCESCVQENVIWGNSVTSASEKLEIDIQTDNQKDFLSVAENFIRVLENDCPFSNSENKPVYCSEDYCENCAEENISIINSVLSLNVIEEQWEE